VGAGPGGVLTSFYEGMGTLINAHASFLGDRLKTGVRAESIDKNGDVYSVHLSNGGSLEADSVVCASPAHATAEIVRGLDKSLTSTLAEIFYPSVSVVCLGYRKEKIAASLDGFGFLIPFGEGRKILGTLWDSSVFPNRAPEGHVLLRTMLGGARRSELAETGENRLIDLVMGELKHIMKIDATPDFAKVYVHQRGIPQYFLGHESKVKAAEDIVSRFKGLYLTGNAYRGIGVNDCIENSAKLAERILQGI
ncbi:MAG TPA: protoporphyrinogen oxidase, partial [Thermodesulfovibrionales bacterium]|nr:protoporphyrinogen oxidase [Thermodesulfovibrionales bacterium]